MNTPEPELPIHLYDENTPLDGNTNRISFSAERLVAWSEQDRGDAIEKWCKQIYKRKLESINAWEDDRILQLEDEWMSIEQDVEEDEDDENEQRYHQASDAVVRQAAGRRARAREEMTQHSATIRKLVQEARAHIDAHTPPPQEEHYVGYFIAIAIVAAVAYVAVS